MPVEALCFRPQGARSEPALQRRPLKQVGRLASEAALAAGATLLRHPRQLLARERL